MPAETGIGTGRSGLHALRAWRVRDTATASCADRHDGGGEHRPDQLPGHTADALVGHGFRRLHYRHG